jgi:serine protease Do
MGKRHGCQSTPCSHQVTSVIDGGLSCPARTFPLSHPLTLPLLFLLALAPSLAPAEPAEQPLALEQALVDAARRVTPAFVFISGGSGVCISQDGWILTNYHVIAAPIPQAAAVRSWRVTFAGGRRVSADLVGYDLRGDLALLKVADGKDLPFAELGNSDALHVGQHVFAVGNPFMLGARVWEPAVSFGIVSALHRFQEGYSDAIQVDTQINPGNSGGPLFTMDGKVVGINGRIALKFGNRVNTGIGYAIPSNQIRRFLPRLKQGGRVFHGFVDGIQIADPDIVGGEYGTGVLVTGVYETAAEGGPSSAAKAGFAPGDLILRVEGARTFNARRFHGVVGTYPAGSIVTMTVRRGAAEKDLEVYLGEPKAVGAPGRPAKRPHLGLTVSRAGERLKIEDVVPRSPAEKAGLKAGDILLEADGEPMRNPEALRQALLKKSPGEELRLGIRRGEEILAISVTLGKYEEDKEGEREKENKEEGKEKENDR